MSGSFGILMNNCPQAQPNLAELANGCLGLIYQISSEYNRILIDVRGGLPKNMKYNVAPYLSGVCIMHRNSNSRLILPESRLVGAYARCHSFSNIKRWLNTNAFQKALDRLNPKHHILIGYFFTGALYDFQLPHIQELPIMGSTLITVLVHNGFGQVLSYDVPSHVIRIKYPLTVINVEKQLNIMGFCDFFK